MLRPMQRPKLPQTQTSLPVDPMHPGMGEMLAMHKPVNKVRSRPTIMSAAGARRKTKKPLEV
jgi:hypothetical protein